jgi:serine/threonine-protein kinase
VSIRVKILDFGIAKLGADRFGEKQKTKGGTILGTPAYMAPEQCKGISEVDARADLYALGCILFELLAGRPPFVSQGGGELMAMHIYEPPPRVSMFAPHVPAELDALIAKMLVKNVPDRVPSAAYTLAALERVPLPTVRESFAVFDANTRNRAATYAPPMGPLTQYLAPPDPPRPPSRVLPILVILLALAIAAAAVYYIGFGDV